MKIKPVFEFKLGVFWDKHRRALSIFLLPFLGICLEFGRGVVQRALPPISTDDDILLDAIAHYPTLHWAALKFRVQPPLSVQRLVAARERLLAAGKIEEVSIVERDPDSGREHQKRVLRSKC